METCKYGECKLKKFNNPKFQEEEEQLRRRFTEQVIWTRGSRTRPLTSRYGVYLYPARGKLVQDRSYCTRGYVCISFKCLLRLNMAKEKQWEDVRLLSFDL
jgi:hypothetical protein